MSWIVKGTRQFSYWLVVGMVTALVSVNLLIVGAVPASASTPLTISGVVSVMNANGVLVPAQNIQVTAYNSGNVQGPVAQASTDAQGSYTLTLSAGTYDVGFQGSANSDIPSGNYSFTYYNGPSSGYASSDIPSTGTSLVSAATNVTVSSSSGISNVDARLLLSGSISGTVSSASSSIPISQLCVFAGATGSTPSAQSAFGQTDNYGAYNISLAPGVYLLSFAPCYQSPSNFVAQYYDGTAAGTTNFSQALDLTVSAGDAIPGLNASMVAGATISGTVKDASGAVVANECVQANLGPTSGSYLGTPSPTALTTSLGTYSITGLAAGSYTLDFQPPTSCGASTTSAETLASQIYDGTPGASPSLGTLAASSATTIPVTTGGSVSGVDATLAAGGAYTGTVTDGTAGMSNVCVFAQNQSPGGVSFGDVTTDANGNYSLPGLSTSATYLLFYQQNCGGAAQYQNSFYPGTADLTAATRLTPTAGSAPLQTVALAQGGSITASIVGADGVTPLSNVCVLAQLDSGGTLTPGGYGGWVSSTGQLDLTGLAPGSYVVTFNDCGLAGYQESFYTPPSSGSSVSTGTLSIANAQPVQVIAGSSPTTLGTVALQANAGVGEITGTVTDSSTNAGVGGICVTASLGSTPYTATTAANGNYIINNVPQGSALVTFNSQNGCGSGAQYATVYANGSTGSTDFSQATPVSVTAGSITANVNATLSGAGTISGTVTNSTGTAISGACVLAFSTTGGSSPNIATTDASGNYSLGGVSPGSYIVVVNDCGSFGNTNYGWSYFTGSAAESSSISSAQSVTVTAGSTVAHIDSHLAGAGTIAGTVTISGSSTPIAGVCTIITPASTPSSASQLITDGNGTFQLGQLPSGNYTLTFTSGCGSTTPYSDATASTTVSDGVTTTVNQSMTPGTPVQTVPSQPSDLSAAVPLTSSLVDGAVVSWSPSANNGGSPITGYAVTPFDVTSGSTGPALVVPGACQFQCSTTVLGLVAGDVYQFAVVAINGIGSSAPVNSNQVLPLGVAPLSAAASNGTGGSASTISINTVGTQSLAATATGGAGSLSIASFGSTSPTGVTLSGSSSYFDVQTSTNASFTSATFQVCGLTTGQSVEWWDTALATPAYQPVSNQSAIANGCSTVTITSATSPTLSQLFGSVFSVATGSSQVVTPPPGPPQTTTPPTTPPQTGPTPVLVTPATAPGQPTAVIVAAHNASASVSWTAPLNDGGAAVTRYFVTASPGGATCTTTSTTCVVSGLKNGIAYTFSVLATNSVGLSVASVSTAVTPSTAPGEPTAVIVAAHNASASVSWTAPLNDGGAAVTRYFVTASPGGATCTTTSTTCVVSGLKNGIAYTFGVLATNYAGSSTSSVSSSLTLYKFTIARVSGTVQVGDTQKVSIIGKGFHGIPAVRSNDSRTSVVVLSDHGNQLVARVRVLGGSTPGWHAFTVTLPNGQSSTVRYLVTPRLRVTKVNGPARVGRTVIVSINGTGFYGKPTIKTGEAGSSAVVVADRGNQLVVRVREPRGSARGWHVFTITLANGHSGKVRYMVQ